ncbi:MAG: hypothetical protein LLG05_09405 [Porphyromonadaceae bacterium]|jgi:hypothetical protein|nr:hypothetical protein [Porphyromonadaceae bacterium]
MPKRKDYELLWDRYQKEGVPNKISIERFCVSNGFAYREFEKWYKQIRCNSFVPIQVTDVPWNSLIQKESLETPIVIEEHPWQSSKLTIKCIRIEFTDGTEIRNRGTNLSAAIELLRKLAN